MGKRRRTVGHKEDDEYNLPLLKSRKVSVSTEKFKPNENAFCELLDVAFQAKLTSLIRAHLKQKPNSDCDVLKKAEQKRKKVPPLTYCDLDEQYGPYWTANTAKRLNVDPSSLYQAYVEKNFADIANSFEQTSINTQPVTASMYRKYKC